MPVRLVEIRRWTDLPTGAWRVGRKEGKHCRDHARGAVGETHATLPRRDALLRSRNLSRLATWMRMERGDPPYSRPHSARHLSIVRVLTLAYSAASALVSHGEMIRGGVGVIVMFTHYTSSNPPVKRNFQPQEEIL